MNTYNKALGFVDSDERLTKLSSLLEIAAGKHVDDVHIVRAAAMVDAIIMVGNINYDVMDVVVKSLKATPETTLDILDAQDLAFDILADLPLSHGSITTLAKHLSPTDEIALTRETVQAVVHEMADEGLLADSGNGVFRITKAGREYAHQLEKAQLANDEDILENLVNEAIENGDYATIKHSDGCPNCGGFSGCACDDTQELPELKPDGICVNCNVFAATQGELCELCTDLLEVDNVD